MAAKSNFTSAAVQPLASFKVTKQDLARLNQAQMRDANKKELENRGGAAGICELLDVDPNVGLGGVEKDSNFSARQAHFGRNVFPEPPMKGWCRLFIESFNDTTLIILCVAAVVSLGIGIYENPSKGWIEGTAIGVAVLIVAVVTATNDYQKELQFRALKAESDNTDTKVIRDGRQVVISVHDVNVGDIVVLEAGDKIPGDLIYLQGNNCKANESSLTGEPDDLSKNSTKDPFFLSGCNMVSGDARAVCIAVGTESRWGRIREKLSTEAQQTPLQEKLDRMAQLIGYLGTGAAILTFIALCIIYATQGQSMLDDKGVTTAQYFITAFIIAITIIVVAIPEGLPLAVTISLAYSTKKMLKDKNLIRVLAACETMGNATNICSDKTGTLTENRMTVVAGWFGDKFFDQDDGLPKGEDLPHDLLQALKIGISMNSTAVLEYDPERQRMKTIGSKTEGALLQMMIAMGSNLGFGNDFYLKEREKPKTRVFSFSSARKQSSILVPMDHGKSRLFVKGASEIVLSCCTHMWDAEGNRVELTDEKREYLKNDVIMHMAKHALRTLCVAHCDFETSEVADAKALSDDWGYEQKLTLQAIVGIIDPLRADVVEAVKNCQSAGIMVRMVTGDNIETAKAIARRCGILTEGGIALEGPKFRTMSPAEVDKILPNLQVLARSSPDDKHTLVTRLNGKALPKNQEEWEAMHPQLKWDTDRNKVLPGYLEEWKAVYGADGEVVGVTGDGTNDAPALKAGDVGLSMGLSGTDVAKEASDIVILDDRFSSIVKAVLWGRSVYDNIRKFLQFQLTVNVVALVLTFIAACTGDDPPLNAVMMLWVNLIMDTMGALALGTEAPKMELLQRMPYKRSAPLVSRPMWRNVLLQSAFQLVVLFIFLYRGAGWLGTNRGNQCVKADGDNCGIYDYSHYTVIFNIFVFCQVFNEFNARDIKDNWSAPFVGLTKNPMFLLVIFFTVVFQIFVVHVGGDFTKTTGLSAVHWGISVAVGIISLPLGILMRFVPVAEDPNTFRGYTFKGTPVVEGETKETA